MPLLSRFENDLFVSRTENEDLRVAKLGDIENWMSGDLVVRAQKRGTGGSGSVPLIGLRRSPLGLLEGSLEVGDGIWLM